MLPRCRPTLAAVALLAGLTGCAAGAQRDDTGAVTRRDAVPVSRLEVGDCLTTPADGVVTDLEALPCDQDHDGEVFHAYDLPEGAFPGAEQIQTAGGQGCLPSFTSLVGRAFDDSALDLIPLTPVQDGWDAGDRRVLCVVQDSRGGLTASLEGVDR